MPGGGFRGIGSALEKAVEAPRGKQRPREGKARETRGKRRGKSFEVDEGLWRTRRESALGLCSASPGLHGPEGGGGLTGAVSLLVSEAGGGGRSHRHVREGGSSPGRGGTRQTGLQREKPGPPRGRRVPGARQVRRPRGPPGLSR